ncbi:MAG: RNA 2',3'-cyclic phosphodiesterase [Bacteroidota bacterium]
MDSLRLFIALETPTPVKERVLEVIETLRSSHADVHWEPGANLHSTVKFLGPTSPDLVAVLTETLGAIGRQHPPLSLSYQSIGFFPNARSARVIWIGILDPDDGLHNLQRAIDLGLAPFGFATETREFHPHLTLGRIRSSRNLHQLIATTETLTFSTALYTFNALSLLRSDLRPSGSVYTQEKSFPLIGKPR